MNINIITIHHIHNFGSVFQAYCLQKYLADLGHDVRIIDYRPSYYEAGRNRLKSVAGRLMNLGDYRRRRQKYESFINEFDRLSKKRFTDMSRLRTEYGDSKELFIAGGDQLWNSYHPCGNDEAYKLAFTDSPKKLAIGTSMGRNNQTDDELTALAEQVSGFGGLFLREECSAERFSTFTDVPCSHIIDPVGLVNPEELRKMAVKPNMDDKYAVMYLADSGAVLDGCVERLHKQAGLKIVHLCGFRKKCFCDVFEKDTGPKELLGYILNANFVLSASFHATMFSIIFNKQFATLLPNVQTNERIESLLKYFGLESRIIRSESDIGRLGNKIDYAPVNLRLSQFVQESREKIIKSLEQYGG